MYIYRSNEYIHRKLKYYCQHFNHSTGIANSQIILNCGPVCLLAELSCFCEVNNSNVMGWRLLGLNMQLIGQGIAFVKGLNTVGATGSFADGTFIATITNVTEMTLTSIATGTVSQTTDGHSLQCFDADDNVGDTELSIPGKLLLATSINFICLSNKCVHCV